MTSERNVFIHCELYEEEKTANAVTDHEVKIMKINTIHLNVDNKIMKLNKTHYMSELTVNLISYEMLEQQDFKIMSVVMINSRSLFKITDLNSQIFHTLSLKTNLYSLTDIKTAVLTARIIIRVIIRVTIKLKTEIKNLSETETETNSEAETKDKKT